MEVKSQDNKIWIHGKVYDFDHNIKKCIVFPNIIVIMFGEKDAIIKNNVIAIDYNARTLWNISDIVNLKSSEVYVSITKETENVFSVISYHGVEFHIDVTIRQIIKKAITK